MLSRRRYMGSKNGYKIVWNQLIKNGDWSSGLNGGIPVSWTDHYWINGGATYSLINGSLEIEGNTLGHGMNTVQSVSASRSDKVLLIGYCEDVFGTWDLRIATLGKGVSSQVKKVQVGRNVVLASPWADGIINFRTELQTSAEGAYVVWKYIEAFNLTLMFGAGNEPTTVEQFEYWLADNIGTSDYYPYNEGEEMVVKHLPSEYPTT